MLKEDYDACMIVNNNVINDPRVLKEAVTLSNNDIKVLVIGIGEEKLIKYNDYLNIVIINENIFSRMIYYFSKKLKKISSINSFNKKVNNNSEKLINKIKAKMNYFLKDIILILMILINNIYIVFTIKNINAKVIHSHDLDTLLSAYVLKNKKQKLIYDAHELWTEMSNRKYLSKIFFNKIEKYIAKKTDLIITVSNSIAKEMCERYNLNNEILLLKNIPDSDLDKDINYSTHKPTKVLYQGGYIKNRGLQELILAAQYLDKNIKIILRGYGNLEDKLKEMVNIYNVNDKVSFKEPVSPQNLIKYASKADIGLILYKNNSLNNKYCLPNKLFEYMHAGLAIISNNLVEIKNLVEKNKVGLILNNLEPENIAYTINNLAKNKNKLVKYKKNSILISKNKYNWYIEGQKLTKNYKKLLKK